MKKITQLSSCSLCAICIGFIIASCGTGNHEQHDNRSADHDSTSVNQAGISFESDTAANVFSDYILLKDALVASDADKAGSAADDLFTHLDQIEGCENTAILAQEIANSHDLSLQRSAFSTLSKDLIALFQHMPLNAGTIYVAHCPMYNNNEGGDWLTTSSEIKNPYFGNEMLTCGTIEQEIK